MFPYDPALAAAVQNPPQSIPDVLRIMQTIDATCVDQDGLKWFNWLYLQVTQAVEARVSAGEFAHTAWLAQLDVQFARLYFGPLQSVLAGGACPGCWQAMFDCRDNLRIARIQFALAGINAHINHDLPQAVMAACRLTNTVPRPGSPEHFDYSALNSTFDALIDTAKETLRVRLPGDALPPVSHLEDLIAAWNVGAAREQAWKNAESLWNLPALLSDGLMESIDGLTSVIGKALLIPVP